ncbi:uncharacterized protein LODBEIA_P13990 [Lodderomyces beijingensis]|uniref:Uncharacterized protein n=1 Tax=Lodderomyces beijingensis TaxID=1775926 RepID=A0ABP0ZIZ5_9ASCO
MIPSRILLRQAPSPTYTRHIRAKPKLTSLLRTPTTKSLILSLICTSVMVDLLKAKRETQQLQASYMTKFTVLREVIEKLHAGVKVDLSKELQLANAFTLHKYNSKTDIEFDASLEEFLKMADEPVSLSEVQVSEVLEGQGHGGGDGNGAVKGNFL